jgi:hypothetical protein
MRIASSSLQIRNEFGAMPNVVLSCEAAWRARC